jgi:hypothetical protein
MDHATDLLESVPGCENVVLATDGSMEGILKAMSSRAGVPSIFKKDEMQGFMASVGKKDYLAGMLEGLTKLYDGKTMKRQLSKDSVTVHRPIFIVQAGGTKTKMLGLLNQTHIETGFLPRFLFVTAEGDVDKMKPLGPRTTASKAAEGKLRNELAVLHSVYAGAKPYAVGSQTAMASPQVVAVPSQACWDRYAVLERVLIRAAYDSLDKETYTPMMSRFAMSTLKCAMLLAAARQEPKDDKIVVEAFDLVDALSFTSKWTSSMIEVLQNIGRSVFEDDTQRVYRFVRENDGTPSGVVMRRFKLSAREMHNILETLDGRGMIDIRKAGKAKMLWVVES